MDCDTTNDGCEGVYWTMSLNGLCRMEELIPKSNILILALNIPEKIDGVTIDGYNDVTEEESAVLCPGIDDGDYSLIIDHAMLSVGYSSEDYLIVKNSWGTDWGVDGYVILKPVSLPSHRVVCDKKKDHLLSVDDILPIPSPVVICYVLPIHITDLCLLSPSGRLPFLTLPSTSVRNSLPKPIYGCG
eukprot:Gb_27402 [translate_table: standard]